MTLNIIDETVKALLQLVVLGVIGGAVAWFFSQLQNKKELKLSTLREFAELHGQFMALRYEFNSFYIQWKGQRGADFHPLTEEEQRIEKWKYYKQACHLLGEFQSLRPIIVEVFPQTKEDIDYLFTKYQDWRRRTGSGKPILQELDGKNEESYNELRNHYNQAVKHMRKAI